MAITIYHNPACSTSRKVLGMLRDGGHDPKVIEYMKTPPSRETLVELLKKAGLTPRDILRKRGTPYDELGLDNPRLDGRPVLSRIDPRVDFRWTLNSPGRGIPFDWYSARWTATLTAPDEGVRQLAIEGNDGYRLWLDGTVVIDRWFKRSFGRQVVNVDLAPGTHHDLRLEFFESTGNARLKLLWDAAAPNGTAAARRKIDDAVALAVRLGSSDAFKRGQVTKAVANQAAQDKSTNQRRTGLGKPQDQISAAVASKTSNMAMTASKLVC